MDLFNLFARVTLDTGDYEKNLDEAGGKTSSFADKLKNGLATAAKVGAAAVGAAATAVVALTKNSIEQYSEYEQLTGGVETLFGKSADIVMGYAENAYKTAGMSANEYMNTVTGFSASLLQSLDGDTQAAAQKADLAITDMSDNANKMGTSMESIQNAYQGFAKQNFTMLDNLKLGYGGTKEEMQRLLEDASKLSGIKYDISSYADIVDAIHVVQTEMGITGTTSKEASTTIQGSVSAMKSAWSNLVVGLADDNADMDKLIGNFVDSVGTAGQNIVPRIEKILGGIGALAEKLAPIIAKEVPNIITNVLPSFASAGVEAIQGIIGGLVSALPTVASAAVDILIALATSIIENLPMLLDAAVQIVQTLVEQIANSLPDILKTGADVLESLVSGIEDGIPDMIDRLPEVIDGFLNFITENLPKILEKGVELLNRLTIGIIQAIPQLIAQLPQIIRSFVNFISNNLPTIVQAGLDILMNLVKGIIDAIPELVAALPDLISAIVDGIGSLLGSIWDIGVEIVNSIIDGIAYAWNSLVDWFNGLWDSLFGNRNVNVNVNQATSGGVNGSHASGLSYVPFDGYIAELHRGERVLTAREASQYRGNAQDERPIKITVQSVLDGRVIGETAYTYNRRRERAMGT